MPTPIIIKQTKFKKGVVQAIHPVIANINKSIRIEVISHTKYNNGEEAVIYKVVL